MTPEAITAEEKQDVNSRQLPVNPGDVIDESQSIEEKAEQLAVNAPDITGDWIRVPTYFTRRGAKLPITL